MAKHLKVDAQLITDFQEEYLPAFSLKKWHRNVAYKIQTEQKITTAMGMERIFFSRPDDDATIRSAIAFEPQSVVGQMTNQALLQLWHECPDIRLLLQIHDAIGFLYPDSPQLESDLLSRYQKIMEVPVQFGAQSITIPSEMKVGWNWGNFDPKKPNENPDGLMKFRGKDVRVRTAGRLDNLLSSIYSTHTKS
jgi:DNA polymerase I-like protein with 3'-5' exonuclease and polymerase domains